MSRSESFEQAIAGGDKNALKQFCDSKAGDTSGDEAETWSFLSVLFEEDARRQLLNQLGFADAVKVSWQAQLGWAGQISGIPAG